MLTREIFDVIEQYLIILSVANKEIVFTLWLKGKYVCFLHDVIKDWTTSIRNLNDIVKKSRIPFHLCISEGQKDLNFNILYLSIECNAFIFD